MKAQKEKSLDFRKKIFEWYGFTEHAREFIRANSAILVRDLQSTAGGGFWHPDKRLVEVFGAQHESTVHELSHVWWHWFRLEHGELRKDLARDVVRLSDMDPGLHPEFVRIIHFAREYAFGAGEWIGMYGNADYHNNRENLPHDVHNLTEEDFEFRVNDWEIFAGFSSFTMGKFKDGPRKIPEFMWKYFEQLFSGKILVIPYYMTGGHP